MTSTIATISAPPAPRRAGAFKAAAALAALLATAGLFAGPALAQTQADDPSGIAVLLCPAVRPLSFPAGDGTVFNTLAVPRVAVVNAGENSVEISEIRIDLLQNGRVMASRALQSGSVRSLGAAHGGACDAPGGRTADLAVAADMQPNQAMLLPGDVFGWTGQRDAVRVVVRSRRAGEEHRVAAIIPIRPPATAPAA